MNFKIAFAAVAMMAITMVGCGSACDDYKTKLTDCCATITDEAAAKACTDIIDAYDFDNATDDVCQAASDAFTCPKM